MLKTASLCTGAEWNLRDKVLTKVENNIYCFARQREPTGLCPSKLCAPTQRDLVSVITGVQGAGFLIRIEVCAGSDGLPES